MKPSAKVAQLLSLGHCTTLGISGGEYAEAASPNAGARHRRAMGPRANTGSLGDTLRLRPAPSDGVPSIPASQFVGNVPSLQVAERLGLPFLGVQPDAWYDGDSRIYKLTRDEWLARSLTADVSGPPRRNGSPSGSERPNRSRRRRPSRARRT